MARRKKPGITRRSARPAAPAPENPKVEVDDLIGALKDVATAIREGHATLHSLFAGRAFVGTPKVLVEPPAAVKVVVTEQSSPVEPTAAPAPVEPKVKRAGRGRPPKDPCPECGSASKPIDNGLMRCNQDHVWQPEGATAGPAPAAPAATLTLAPTPAAPEARPAPVPTAEVAPPPPAPATLDALRAVAISFATKHGREGLTKVLAAYGAEKISSVPEERRAELLAALS